MQVVEEPLDFVVHAGGSQTIGRGHDLGVRSVSMRGERDRALGSSERGAVARTLRPFQPDAPRKKLVGLSEHFSRGQDGLPLISGHWTRSFEGLWNMTSNLLKHVGASNRRTASMAKEVP